MNPSRSTGQSAIETAVLIAVAVIALVALSGYVRYGVAGRVKAGTEGVSTVLYDPERTVTTWTSTERSRDRVETSGVSGSMIVDVNAVSTRNDYTP